MITNEDKKAIIESWRLVVPIKETAADLFYRRLFELKPEYRSLFPQDIAAQKRKLIAMLAFVVKSMRWHEDQWKEDKVGAPPSCFLTELASSFDG